MDRDRAANCLRDRPKLVDAVAMVTMGMGDDDATEATDFGRQQLLAKIRSAIDQHSFSGAFDQDRSAQAAIARLLRIAPAPFVANLRDSGRRPAS